MCHTPKGVMTSKVQIQAHTLVWSLSFPAIFWILVMFTFCEHLIISFDMVAELVRTKVQEIKKKIWSITKTTITSSSGEERRFKWDFHLQEGVDISMFAHDHRVPRVPQPTSFDGVKPSFLEWSEEVIAYLAVTDYHEFIPLLSAAAASKDVIEKDVMFKGILSENMENIDKVTAQRIQKEQDKKKASDENKPQDVQDITKEIKVIQEELDKLNSKLEQKKSALLKADFFLRYTLLHATSGDPNVMVRRIMRTSDSDSGSVTGLEIWRQMSIHFAGSAKTRTVSLLKQIMSPVEWNAEKSKDVIQQYYHWLELISKYEAISSEKISDTVKITLALQNVKKNLAQSLNVSISDSTTWPQVHALLINYFNNAVPVDLKPIYQFDQSEKTEINSFKKGKGKGQKSKGLKGKGSKGPRHFRIPRVSQKAKARPSQRVKVNGLLGHGVKISRMPIGIKIRKVKKDQRAAKENQLAQFAENQDMPQISAGGIEIKKDGSLKDQHRNSKEVLHLSTQKEVYNIHQYPQDQPVQSLPPDQLRRISRSTTSGSVTAISESESSVNSMRFHCDCSFEFRSSRWIQWTKTQHQLSV